MAARSRSWEIAERKARHFEVQADPLRKSEPAPSLRITIEHAVKDFLKDEEARQLAATSTCQSKTLLKKQLLRWAQRNALVFLDDLTTANLRDFRASWKNRPLTMQRKHHRLNGFFDFCIENEWLLRNPSKRMKSVKVSQAPTDYFTPSEFAKIVSNTKLAALTRLAGMMHSAKQKECSAKLFIVALGEAGSLKAKEEAVLSELIEDAMLVSTGRDTYIFPHLSFQEFLAARDIAEPSGSMASLIFPPLPKAAGRN